VASSWWEIFLRSSQFWLVWTLPTVVVFRLVRRFPIAGTARERSRAIAVHVVASLLWMPVYALLLFPTVALIFGVPLTYLFRAPGEVLGARFLVEYSLWWGIFAVAIASQAVRAQRDNARLARDLTEARLAALRGQLQPHFLFNSLAAISGLLRGGSTAEAAGALGTLADLLRQVTVEQRDATTPLARELEFADRYLELQRLRVGERLTIRRSVDPQLLDAIVPSLLLQPLIENAFEHGISRVAGPASFALDVCRAGDGRLAIEVRNSAPPAPERSDGTGLGLANTTARLGLIYGDAYAFEFRRDAVAGSAIARIDLPVAPPPIARGHL
jgi:hypothetical protein